MEVKYPKRILAVSQPQNSPLPEFVKDLTGTTPSPNTPLAGSSHTYSITTPYYTASIPIWLDETTSPSRWANDFLAPEAKEVLSVLGAVLVVFRKPVDSKEFESVKVLLKQVGRVVEEGCGGYAWEGVALAVGVANGMAGGLEVKGDEWEDVCGENGFEWVDWEGKGRNEFSEPVGPERLKEALAANSWDGDGGDGSEPDFEDLEAESDGDESGSLDFGIGKEEMKDEMAGMKRAIYSGQLGEEDEEGQEDEEVEKLQAMMLKMQAVRDMGADMPEAERKKFAAKAVNDIMKTL